jgi:hypothetical protein
MIPITRLPQIIRSLAIKNLLHLFAVIWLSVIGLLCLFVRPDVIEAVGDNWSLTVLPMFALLYLVWISFVLILRQDARFFAVTDSAGRPRILRPNSRRTRGS